MGRKPIENKRAQFNRYVAGATPPLVKALALELGLSEGEVIDRAVQMLAVAESFGTEAIRKNSDLAQSVRSVKSKVEDSSPSVGAKFVPPPRFLKRRTE